VCGSAIITRGHADPHTPSQLRGADERYARAKHPVLA
jgi:hypothetical protein